VPPYLRKSCAFSIIVKILAAAPPPTPMESKPKRPVSVWVAQIILSIVVLLMLLSLAMTIFIIFAGGATSSIVLIIPILFSVAVAAFYFAGVYGMAIRRSWGRWLGVTALSLCLIFSTIAQLFPVDGPMQRYEYKNGAERFGGFIGGAIIFGLFLWLILHLALSKRVTEFFAPVASPEIDEPPPPPTFED